MPKKEPTPFSKEVYEAARLIPCGRVSTYGEIARFLKRPRTARAVGNALHNNPFAPEVPCHRVVLSNGHLGGFADGAKRKITLLKKEGVISKAGRIDNWPEVFFSFK
ncbi:MAG: MGMT family protein [Patescibacteria group bacterium]|nr:MGMT family protein [Patescibacteria group bacterium]